MQLFYIYKYAKIQQLCHYVQYNTQQWPYPVKDKVISEVRS